MRHLSFLNKVKKDLKVWAAEPSSICKVVCPMLNFAQSLHRFMAYALHGKAP